MWFERKATGTTRGATEWLHRGLGLGIFGCVDVVDAPVRGKSCCAVGRSSRRVYCPLRASQLLRCACAVSLRRRYLL